MKLMAALIITTFAVSANHSVNHLCSGIVEENDAYITVEQQKRGAGLTEEQFHKVLDKVERIYAPIVASKGGTLKVSRNWKDGTVNAYAQQFGSTWQISMFGGLARHETITEDGFALVACHEIGHHIGGAPRKGFMWASNEGQSDYFANLKCLRVVFAEEDNEEVIAGMQVDAFAKEECESEFSDRKDQLICMRGAMAGMSVANLFRDLRKEARQPSFLEPDANVVSATNHNHPATQCRLDTYFNGSRCTADLATDVSASDHKVGTCDVNAFNTGSRPKCWFKH